MKNLMFGVAIGLLIGGLCGKLDVANTKLDSYKEAYSYWRNEATNRPTPFSRIESWTNVGGQWVTNVVIQVYDQRPNTN